MFGVLLLHFYYTLSQTYQVFLGGLVLPDLNLRKSLQKPVEDRHSESALIQFYCQSYKIHCSAQYVNEFSSTFTPPLQFDHLRHCSTNTSFLSLIFIIPSL